jgi:hypothetical protein
MKKMMCVILGLAFLVLGILGITGLVPMFQSNAVYLNIGEIILGGLGFLVGVYARQNVVYSAQKIMSAQQENDSSQQRKEIDQQRKDIDQQRKELDQQAKDYKEKPEENKAV